MTRGVAKLLTMIDTVYGKNTVMSIANIQRERRAALRYVYRVDKHLLKARIVERLSALGLSEPEATRRAGLHKHTIQNIKKGHIPSAGRLAALAVALGVPSTYLTGETNSPDASSLPQFSINDSNRTSIPLKVDYIVGEVRAGAWLEATEWPRDEQVPLALPVDPEYEHLPRFGVLVRGPSMNELYPEGTVLICVRLLDLRREPQNGERVIVHRKRPDGLVEATVKEYVKTPDGRVELWPRSLHPDHKKHLALSPDRRDSDTETEIYGIVIGSYRPEKPLRYTLR